MKLTQGEKLILLMLADIHKALKINNGIDANLVETAVSYGHLWSLDWEYGDLLKAEDPSDEAVSQTTNILEMWRMLEQDFTGLDETGKEKVRAAYGRDPDFPGFDGNNEDHYHIAGHMIGRMHDRFTHFAGRDLNSHHEVVGGYLRMYARFEPIRNKLGHDKLTADQIVEVLTARRQAQAA